MKNHRLALILSRARLLFRTDLPGVGWPSPTDLSHDEKLMKLQATYLERAEQELIVEGIIDHVDQS